MIYINNIEKMFRHLFACWLVFINVLKHRQKFSAVIVPETQVKVNIML